MKIIITSCFIFLINSMCCAQLSSLSENFNSACALVGGFPSGWQDYNVIPATYADGDWQCTPTEGRPNAAGAPTPGMLCTSVYNSQYNTDTAYLITPLLNFASLNPLPAHLYLDFDSKVTNVNLGGKLTVIHAVNDSFSLYASSDSDLAAGIVPAIGMGDSSGWVTHQVEITSFIHTGNFYLAFRYVGTTTEGSTWYLDNVNTTTVGLNVPQITAADIPLTVIGQSTPSQIVISFNVPLASLYRLSVYDMLGREVHQQMIRAAGGRETYTINGLDLQPGIFLVKMSNETNYAVARAVVQ